MPSDQEKEEASARPDYREANEFLLQKLGPEVYHDLRFNRGKLSMRDAELILERRRAEKQKEGESHA